MGPGPAGVPGKAPGWGGDFAVSQRGSHGEPDFGRFGGRRGPPPSTMRPGSRRLGTSLDSSPQARAHLRSRDFHAANRRRLPGCGSVHRPAGPDGGGHFPGCHRFGGRRPVPGADAAWGLCTGDRGSAGCGCRIAEGPGEIRIQAPAQLQSVSPIRTAPLARVSHRCPSAGDGGAAPVPGRYGVRRDGICRPVSPCPCPQGPGRPDQVSGAIAALTGCRSSMARSWRPQTCGAGRPWWWGVGRPGDQPDRGGVRHILRGYEDFARRLAAVGANIRMEHEAADGRYGGLYYGLGRTGRRRRRGPLRRSRSAARPGKVDNPDRTEGIPAAGAGPAQAPGAGSPRAADRAPPGGQREPRPPERKPERGANRPGSQSSAPGVRR